MSEKTMSSVIGKTIVIKGDVSADEELLIEGQVKGTVISSAELTVGEPGQVEATIAGGTVVVAGTVKGDIIAREKVEVGVTGVVEGNLTSPKVVMPVGARVRGFVDMSGPKGAKPAPSPVASAAGAPQGNRTAVPPRPALFPMSTSSRPT